MRPRKPSKPDADVQVNLRIEERLRRQLEAAAEGHHTTFSQEVRARLVESLEIKTIQSLADYFAGFERAVCDVIEQKARHSKDPEGTWRSLGALRASLAHFQTDVEKTLLPYMPDPEVRKLIRGKP